jgi:hypothetical protein
MTASVLAGLSFGAGWFWLHDPGRETLPTVSRAAVAKGLRVSSGSSTVRIQPGADGLAALALPGFPELEVRVTRGGSEMTVELYKKVDRPGQAPRVALLRLTPPIPADLTLGGGRAVSFVWEDPAPRSR